MRKIQKKGFIYIAYLLTPWLTGIGLPSSSIVSILTISKFMLLQLFSISQFILYMFDLILSATSVSIIELMSSLLTA